MPAAWSDEMAQMQVMAFAQGWSLKHGVTLILSNMRGVGESGSGDSLQLFESVPNPKI